MSEALAVWPGAQSISLAIPFYLLDIRSVEKQFPATAEVEERFSRHRHVLMRQGQGRLELLLDDYVLLVSPDQKVAEPDRLKLFGSRRAESRDKREFLRSGVCVTAQAGWRVVGKAKALDGYSATRAQVFKAFYQQLESLCQRVQGEVAAPPEVDQAADDVLNTLAAYTDMEYELEREDVQGEAHYMYQSVAPARGERSARIPYRFALEAPSDLEEGALLEVELKDGTVLQGQVTAVTPVAVTVTFVRQFNFRELPAVGLLRRAANDVQHRVRQQVIDDLRTGAARSAYLLPMLAHGEFRPPASSGGVANPPQKMNPSQRRAVELGSRVEDLLLVLGPPGTGKTTVIAEWVYHYVSQGQRLLISSKNNAAVDNVLERLMDERKRPPGVPRLRIVRVGHEDRVAANVTPILLDHQAASLQKELLGRSQLALNPFLQAMPLVAAYAEAANRFYEVLEEARQQRAALQSAQQQVVDQWRPQLAALHSRIVGLQREGQGRLEGWERWTASAQRLAALGSRNPVLGWLVALPASLVRRWADGAAAAVTALQSEEADLLELYKGAWSAVESLWHSAEMLEVKQRCWVADRALNRLTAEVVEAAQAAFTAVAPLGSGFKLPSPPTVDLPSAKQAKIIAQSVEIVLARMRTVAKVTGNWQEALTGGRRQVLYDLLLRMVDVVGATCIGINSDKRFAEVDFDVTVVDEAGQIQAHDVMVPLSRSPRAILVGDHLQLPPVVKDVLVARAQEAEVETELLTESLFEVLYSQAPAANKVLLDTQYRMPAEIADFISVQFYQGEYKSPDFKRGLRPILPCFRAPVCLVDTRAEPTRRETRLNPGYQNRLEAELAAELVVAAHRAGLSFDQIGVITPYAHQAALIYQFLTQHHGLTDATGVLEDNIATVDSFQGQERKLIIYTFTRSHPSGRIGFLKELRRLNVALTRPQEQLVLVGDFGALVQADDEPFAEMARGLLETVQSRGDYTSVAEMRRRLSRAES